MSQTPPPDEQKRRVTATFDNMASRYDKIHFLQLCARSLVEGAALKPDDRVLDVATGTGVVALTSAALVGSGGRVVGVDLSADMLAQAQKKLSEAGYPQVEMRQGDAQHLDFPDGSFDAVLCASSLFFMPDMDAVLREWRRVLVPDGTVGFSSFGESFLQPLRDMWSARLAEHGVTMPPLPNRRLEDMAVCQTLLNEAGFTHIEVRTEQLGYYVPAAADRWDDIESGLEGMILAKLPPEQHQQIKNEHIAELELFASTAQGIWIDMPVVLSYGRKPLTD